MAKPELTEKQIKTVETLMMKIRNDAPEVTKQIWDGTIQWHPTLKNPIEPTEYSKFDGKTKDRYVAILNKIKGRNI